jgi:hypothetical protein
VSQKPTETPVGQPIVQPIVDELKGVPPTKKEEKKADEKVPPPGPIHPPKPAELDQDPGGGYNPGHTYPQT